MRLRHILPLLLAVQSLLAVDAVFHADSLHGSLGDVISFGWSIEHDTESLLRVGEYAVDGSGIEVLDQKQMITSTGTDLTFETAIFDSVGIYHFPSITAYVVKGTEVDSLLLQGPDLEIFSILTVSDSTFRDIKGLHGIRLPFNLVILAWIIGSLIILYLVYWLVKRYTRSEKAITEQKIIVPPEEAHVIALRELETLKRSKYLRFEQFKEFYSELTHILKAYYENRYLIDALELTTSEFMELTSAMAEFNDELLDSTREILETADFIKFAKGSSNELEAGEALSRTIQMVKETMIKDDQGEKS